MLYYTPYKQLENRMSLIQNLRAARAALVAIKAPCLNPTAQCLITARNKRALAPDLDDHTFAKQMPAFAQTLRDAAAYADYKKRKAAAAELVAKIQQQIADQPKPFDTAPLKAEIKQCRLELAALPKPPKLSRFNASLVEEMTQHINQHGMAVQTDRYMDDEHFRYIAAQHKLQTDYTNARNALNRRIADLNAQLLATDQQPESDLE